MFIMRLNILLAQYTIHFPHGPFFNYFLDDFSIITYSLNQAGGGVPIQMESAATQAMGSDYMAESIAEAMRQMPNPVVSVQEITDVNHRVFVLENTRNR